MRFRPTICKQSLRTSKKGAILTLGVLTLSLHCFELLAPWTLIFCRRVDTDCNWLCFQYEHYRTRIEKMSPKGSRKFCKKTLLLKHIASLALYVVFWSEKSQLRLLKVLPKIFLGNKHVVKFWPASPHRLKVFSFELWRWYNKNEKFKMDPREPF